jgi:hypothetical protein
MAGGSERFNHRGWFRVLPISAEIFLSRDPVMWTWEMDVLNMALDVTVESIGRPGGGRGVSVA